MTDDVTRRYASPDAMRKAVTDKLRAQAEPRGTWTLSDLQRQYAYDQLVERLYRVDDGWVVKGATALLARRVSVRHTIDIDLYRAGAIDEVEGQLREGAALDIGDWMRFEVGASVRIRAAGAQAARVRVASYIGAKQWAAFQVDIVADGISMTGEPEPVPPLTSLDVLDRERALWLAYPLVDHVADKLCAIFERHDGRPSTRYKDLVDLVAIATSSAIPATLQMEALTNEAARRDLRLPSEFDVPDRALWERGYGAEAKRTVNLQAITLDQALATVRPFVDALLDATAAGAWDPVLRTWRLAPVE